ncbi:putative carbonic anhydrase 5 [Anabrus simplex]|uniref:putative carbonic anhydrase 5 n=1 Tax=Anabrus simplex TaxID=316456 RepID=UPI0035A3739C
MGFQLLLITIIVSVVLGQEADWGYDRQNGPETWRSRFSGCGGNFQSPINLGASRPYAVFNMFYWEGDTNVPIRMELFNNGETVVLNGTWLPGRRPSIVLTSNGLRYVLDSIHWHWGRTRFDGTEHALNNVRYDMEMHIVTRLASNSRGSSPDRLVYSQLFQIGLQDQTPGMSAVAENLAGVITPNSRQQIWPFSIDELIAWQQMPFYSYQGSLTTPPCTEPILWIVAGQPTGISFDNIEEFRSLENRDGEEMAGNVRPLQPINGRRITVDLS